MEKQVLKENILRAVGLKKEYIDKVYEIFLNKISDVLQVNQTIKFEDLGYFQLRVEPVSRLNRDSSKKGKKILIYESIESEDQLERENLFLSFDIEPENHETSVFNESVFNLSIDKPSTIFDESNTEKSDDYLEESIHDYVHQFIAGGIILDGYELLRKDPIEKIDTDETLSSDIIKEVSGNEPIEPILEPEESINNEPLSDEQNLDENLSDKKDSEHQIDDTLSTGSNDGSAETEKEKVSESDDEKRNPFDELNDLLNKEIEPQAEEEVNGQAIYDEVKSSVHQENRGSKRLLFLSFAAVFVILIIAIIYFTSGPSSTSTQIQSYVDEKVDSKTEEASNLMVVDDSTNTDSSQNKETSGEVVLLKEEVKELERKVPPKQAVKPIYSGLYREINRDDSITDRIYFDGQKYTVQISSWKSKTIAEHEVQRLKKLGFDAFIYRVYIKSKDGTWNRVRIGYFESKNEAANFLKVNKL
jgi:cell division protein FtsN/nucleoid DNA-binding protein